jgi:tetratricopeptide (TPR) repeat protein
VSIILVSSVPLFGRSRDKEYEKAAKVLADGQTQEAIDLLREILSKRPDNKNARISLAVALMQAQDKPDKDDPLTKEALQQLDTAAKMNPKDPVPYFNKGVLLRNIGLREDALRSFEIALDIDKRLALAIAHMAEINYELERWDKAIELARLALVRDPGLEGSMGWVRVAMRKAGMLDDEGNPIVKPSE